MQLLDCLHKYRFIILLKAKQIGATWCLAGDNLHLAQYLEGANILTLSKGEREAAESLGYSKFIHSMLPDFLRVPFGKEQESLLSFPAMHSKIVALPTTKDAGVGFGGATRVVLDEFEYHEYDKRNYSELLPAILRGGQLIIQSTADALKMDSLFKELYTAARHGDNNFYPMFFPYDVVPGQDEKWRETLPQTGLKPYMIACRFPRNEQEALKVENVILYFNEEALNELKNQSIGPIKHELSDKYRTVKIYKPAIVGNKYCGFCDPSDGREDPHASIFIDAISKELVAESHGKIRAEIVAEIFDALVRYYNNAFNSNEVNATAGGTVDTKLQDLETPNRCSRILATGKLDEKQKGWYTTEPLRRKVLERLDEFIRFRQIRIYNSDIIEELENFIQVEGDKPQAREGAHDDYVMAFAGVLETLKYMRLAPFEIKIQSFAYRT